MDAVAITIVVTLGLLAALVYFPLTNRPESWPRSALKTWPLLCFAFASYQVFAPPFLTLALFLSALGDFALSRDGKPAFLYGLSAFALAHLVYVLVLLPDANATLLDAFTNAPLPAVAMIGFALSTEVWLAPHTGAMRWPVRGYIALITAMGLAALTQPMQVELLSATGGQMVLNFPAVMVIIGAGLFILSDIILSLSLFRMGQNHRLKVPAGWSVWLFYITGQMLLMIGIIT